MTWRPIAGAPFQISASDNTLASGYYLKFYQSGTTTATNMATDSTGGTTLAKCQINAAGYPINGSSAVFIPYIDQKYKLALYTNSTDADADTLGNADWVVDTIDWSADIRDELANTANSAQGDALIGVLRTDTDAEATTQHQVNETRVIQIGADYGASLSRTNGTDDWTTVIQNAIDSFSTNGAIFLPRGIYGVTGLTLPTAIEVSIFGEAGTEIKALAGTTAVLTYTNDITRGGYRYLRDIRINGNSVANVVGIQSGDTTSAVLYLSMENVFVTGCATGIDMNTAMEHTLKNVTCISNTIGLKLYQDATNGGGNANGFFKCAFQSNTVGVFYYGSSVYPMHNNIFSNCLFQENTLCGFAAFDADDGLQFTTCHFEANASAGTTLAVNGETVTKSELMLHNCEATFFDCAISSSANPGIILEAAATIRLHNSYGYGTSGGEFIQGTLAESVEFYGFHSGLGRITAAVTRWPDTFAAGTNFMAIGEPLVVPSRIPVNDYVASSPTTPTLGNAVVATINADAGDSEMGMVSSATFTTAVGTTSTNRVTIDALPTAVVSGDTWIVTFLVKSSISADIAFSIESGSYITFSDCPVDTKWRRVTLAFTASSGNATLLYVYSPDSSAPTIKFAKIHSTRIASGGDLKQISEVMCNGWFNNNQDAFYYTAAPTVGTWKVGDKVYNTAPAVDGNSMISYGWLCTVAGTPGTWVAMYVSTASPAT